MKYITRRNENHDSEFVDKHKMRLTHGRDKALQKIEPLAPCGGEVLGFLFFGISPNLWGV